MPGNLDRVRHTSEWMHPNLTWTARIGDGPPPMSRMNTVMRVSIALFHTRAPWTLYQKAAPAVHHRMSNVTRRRNASRSPPERRRDRTMGYMTKRIA